MRYRWTMAVSRKMFAASAIFMFGAAILIMNSCGDDSTGPGGNVPLTQVTTGGGWHPTVSPDGARVAYNVTGGYVMVKGPAESDLDTLGYGVEPDWCRAGNGIVVRQGGTLVVLDPDSGDVLWSRTEIDDLDDDPAWSPAGDEIAAQGDGILIVEFPSGTVSYVTCDDDGGECEGEGPTWSSDGEWIAFEDGMEIMKVARDGGEAVEVAGGLRDVSYPSWSPNGSWIAFTMQDTTGWCYHIWVADARGTAYGLWQVTEGSYWDTKATWSPDSRVIYFDRCPLNVEGSCDGPRNIWKIGFDAEE